MNAAWFKRALSTVLSLVLALAPLGALGEELPASEIPQATTVDTEDIPTTDEPGLDELGVDESALDELFSTPEDDDEIPAGEDSDTDYEIIDISQDSAELEDETSELDPDVQFLDEQGEVAISGEDDTSLVVADDDGDVMSLTAVEDPEDKVSNSSSGKAEDTKPTQEKVEKTPKLWARGRVQGSGLGTAVTAAAGKSAVLGKAGKKLALEQVQLKLKDLTGGVSVRARVTGSGWGAWSAEGKAGAKGARIEGLRVKLTGKAASTHRVYYRVYVSGSGWMGWAKDGALAGTGGKSLAVQALEVRLVAKGSKAPSGGGAAWRDAGFVARVHMQKKGWLKTKSGYSYTLGLAGKSLRLEALKVSRPATDVSGTVRVRARVQGSGWQAERTSGKVAGTTGKSLRLEAVRIRLTGTLEKTYDVYYRAYVQDGGWMAWTKNGKSAGTQGLSLRMEALQVAYVKKGGKAPSATGQKVKKAFVNGDYTLIYGSYGQSLSKANAKQKKIATAAKKTPATPAGWCAAWVSNVYSNAGLGYYTGNANDIYDRYCKSANIKDLKVGMVVAVRVHPHTAAGRIYGHVGVYVGNGMMMDSVNGYVRTISVKDWIAYYAQLVPAKWGWHGNVKVV